MSLFSGKKYSDFKNDSKKMFLNFMMFDFKAFKITECF